MRYILSIDCESFNARMLNNPSIDFTACGYEQKHRDEYLKFWFSVLIFRNIDCFSIKMLSLNVDFN